MIVEKNVVGSLEANCYFVGDKDELFIIDPGDMAEELYLKIQKKGYKVKYILLTHCHFDHIGAACELKALSGAKIGVAKTEKDNYENPDINLSSFFGEQSKRPAHDFTFEDGDVLKSGNFEFLVIETPGHTSGSVCFYAGNRIFCGDTLFYLSYGRYDLPTGDYTSLKRSINDKLFCLPADTICYCGHGQETTIGYEKLYNPIAEKDGKF